MKEGDWICFKHERKNKCGKIIKTFTQIGFENHGKELIVIMPESSKGLFNNATIIIEKSKLKLIN
tara:strand:- start:219 stop:413 length:195 start_codon:yes stop_codon:yes gene_type:complete